MLVFCIGNPHKNQCMKSMNKIHNVFFNFHNTKGNLQRGRAINANRRLYVCIIFQTSNK